MSQEGVEFERLLTVFHSETDDAARFSYAMLGLYASMHDNKAVLAAMSPNVIFWNTAIDALTTSTVVTLGRIFETDAENFPVSRLLKHCLDNLSLFEKSALEERQKASDYGYRASDIQARVAAAYVPSERYFHELKQKVEVFRKYFQKELRPLRHLLYAHRGVADASEVLTPAMRVDPVKLRECVLFLVALRTGLYGLYFDGLEPDLTVVNVSARVIMDGTGPKQLRGDVQVMVLADIKRLMSSITQKS